MHDSSCVSRSSLRSIPSILLSPNNFFANCSVKGSVVLTCRNSREGFTEPSLGDLLLRLRKHGKQFDHYLDDYFGHRRSERDLSVDFETFEKTPDAFEELKESIVARAYSIGRL